MKKFKVLATLLLSTAAVGSLVGCSSDSDETTITETETDTVSYEFWNDKLANLGEYQRDLSKAWSNSVGSEILINSYPGQDSYLSSLSQSIADADTAPDVFTWWSGEQLTSLAGDGQIANLDTLWEELIGMGVPADIKESLSVDGSAYAVPYSLLYNVVIYNKEAFETAGIAEEPSTFDEFLDVCQKLVDAGITPIGLKNNSWASFIWFQAIVAAYDPALYTGVCDGSIPYDDPKMLEVFDIWQDMLDKGYFAHPVSNEDNRKRVAIGECAMFLEPQTSVINMASEYGSVAGEDIDIFAVPSMNDGKDVIFFEVTPLLVPEVMKGESTDNLIKAYYSDETQAVTLAGQGIFIKSDIAIENPTLNKLKEMTASPDYSLMLRYYENTPSEVRDFALTEFAKFIDKVQDGATTLGLIQKEAAEVFK